MPVYIVTAVVGSGGFLKLNIFMERDELFEEAAILIVESKMASASFLQRKLFLDYNRAGRIIDQLEHYKIIGEFEGRLPREVFFHRLEDLNDFLEKIK